MSPARWATSLAVIAALACSAAPGVGEGEPTEPGDGRGAGGETPTGGALDQGAGGGGDPAPGGGARGPKDDPATCVWEGPPATDVSTLPNCGPKASCVPSALVPPEAKSLLASCDGGGACIPNVFIEKNGKFVLPTCRSLYGAEGRCLTTAIPLVKSGGDLIPQDKCEAGEKCLPCFNPFDGTDTTLCKVSCDTGPAEPAKLAPRCCPLQGKDRGVCVPKELLPEGAAASLVEEGACVNAQAGAYVCVPQEVAQVTTPPKTCSGSILLIAGTATSKITSRSQAASASVR